MLNYKVWDDFFLSFTLEDFGLLLIFGLDAGAIASIGLPNWGRLPAIGAPAPEYYNAAISNGSTPQKFQTLG
jgi:hypothetical protein